MLWDTAHQRQLHAADPTVILGHSKTLEEGDTAGLPTASVVGARELVGKRQMARRYRCPSSTFLVMSPILICVFLISNPTESRAGPFVLLHLAMSFLRRKCHRHPASSTSRQAKCRHSHNSALSTLAATPGRNQGHIGRSPSPTLLRQTCLTVRSSFLRKQSPGRQHHQRRHQTRKVDSRCLHQKKSPSHYRLLLRHPVPSIHPRMNRRFSRALLAAEAKAKPQMTRGRQQPAVPRSKKKQPRTTRSRITRSAGSETLRLSGLRRRQSRGKSWA